MEELGEIITKQKSLITDLEALNKQYDTKELLTQNKTLIEETERCRKKIDDLNEKCKKLMTKNEDLNLKLTEQILDEKRNILKISKEKMKVYFSKNTGDVINELDSLEQNYLFRIKRMKAMAIDELGKEDKETIAALDNMLASIKSKIENKRLKLEESKNNINQEMQNAYKDLEEEGLSAKQIKTRIKQNNFEIKIGLNIINKIGILLIILGAATALKYTYSKWFNNTTRAVFIFILGAVFISAGEYFIRKKKKIFAVGLNGGGTAILYYAVFSSYFFLKIMNMGTAMIISIFITALTVFFALRYNSKTTVSFALIGGYLPFFSYVFAFGLKANGIYAAMVYILLLNASLVYISFYKRWSFTNYLSFIVNIPVLIYLISICENQVINIVYCMCTFLLYLFVTLIYPLYYKTKLKKADIVMLTLNTFGSCVIVYGLFSRAHMNNYRGLLALIFCLVYFALGRFTVKYVKAEKDTTLLFNVTSITFAVLVVPFQFGITWLSLGWLIEGVLMTIFGHFKKSNLIEKSGWIVFAICCAVFYIIDFPSTAKYIHLKYTSIIVSSLGILYMYIKENIKNSVFKYTKTGKIVNGFKYFTIINTWIYLIFEGNTLYINYFMEHDFKGFYNVVTIIFINTIMALMLERVKTIGDRMTNYFTKAFNIITAILCISISISVPILYENIGDFKKIMSFIILISINLYVYYALRKLCIGLFSRRKINFELYPIFMTVYIFIVFNLFMLCQFQRDYSSLLISLGYMLIAFVSIIFGFKKKFIYIRRMGLILCIIANAKLFIFDLSYLNMLLKIIAYFSFGLVMLSISYVYQQLKKKLGEE